jgi:hypothetical protein
MIGIGTRVRIKDSYEVYKTVRGMTGTVIWMLSKPSLSMRQFQIHFDTMPHWRGNHSAQDTCFVELDEIEIID